MKEYSRVSDWFVDELGQVWSHKGRSLRLLKQHDNGRGYSYLTYGKKKYYVHRIVAETLIPNPDNLPCVNHINKIRNDNRLCNLEWCDYQYNNEHGMSKSYRIKCVKTGEEFVIHNLQKWGRENKLIPSNLLRKKKDGTPTMCKGFVLVD